GGLANCLRCAAACLARESGAQRGRPSTVVKGLRREQRPESLGLQICSCRRGCRSLFHSGLSSEKAAAQRSLAARGHFTEGRRELQV
ncbi:unnamed protein product, partial [Polarella glacialis]